MVQGMTANRLKLQILDRLKDDITRDMMKVQRLNTQETHERSRQLVTIRSRLEASIGIQKEAARVLVRQILDENLESEQNELGALTREAEEYKETFEQGGLTALAKMVAKDAEQEIADFTTAQYRERNEPKMIERAVSELGLVVSKLNSNSSNDILAKYPFHMFIAPITNESAVSHEMHRYNALKEEKTVVIIEDIDLNQCDSIQVNKDIFLFHYDSKLSVTKLENFAEDDNSKRVALTPGNSKRQQFGIACQRNQQIIISGGFKSVIFGRGGHMSSVLAYDIQKNLWKSKPDMNKTRAWHGSCVLNDKAYVFAGSKSASASRDSIEMLDLLQERKGWQLVAVTLPTPRVATLVGQLNDREIMILGGLDPKANVQRDLLIFDVVDQSLRVAIQDAGSTTYSVNLAPCLMMKRGVVIAQAVCGLVRYNQEDNSLESIGFRD